MLNSEFIKDKFFDKYIIRYFLQECDVFWKSICGNVTYFLQECDVFYLK